MEKIDVHLKGLIEFRENGMYDDKSDWLDDVLNNWSFERWARYVAKNWMTSGGCESDYEMRIDKIKSIIGVKTLWEYSLALNYYGGSDFPIYVRHKSKKCNYHKFWVKKYSYIISGCVTCPICGSNRSKGETAISKYLSFYKIPFERQYSFPDLISEKGRRLRFDFGVLNKNGSLKFLIEFDGIHHFKVTSITNEEIFNRQKHYDELKDQYCIKNNIELVRVSCLDAKGSSYDHILDLLKEKLHAKI
jgi:hypothetical protein